MSWGSASGGHGLIESWDSGVGGANVMQADNFEITRPLSKAKRQHWNQWYSTLFSWGDCQMCQGMPTTLYSDPFLDRAPYFCLKHQANPANGVFGFIFDVMRSLWGNRIVGEGANQCSLRSALGDRVYSSLVTSLQCEVTRCTVWCVKRRLRPDPGTIEDVGMNSIWSD